MTGPAPEFSALRPGDLVRDFDVDAVAAPAPEHPGPEFVTRPAGLCDAGGVV
ncbi:hypothetical protein ACFXG4_31340 [Nocardia sp. NPDC059246]|uniref:hypothetical protein n=1 Tax=unclassified Nocardia TaxID=2637762 RepID=UPI00368C1F90